MVRSGDYQVMLDIAIAEARLGLAEGCIPIGAAMFDGEGTLLEHGHNRRVQENDPSVHAETNAFLTNYVAANPTIWNEDIGQD